MSDATSMQPEAITAAALALPFEERAALADTLLASLKSSIDEKVLASWMKLVNERREAIRRGEMTTLPLDEVMASVQSRFSR